MLAKSLRTIMLLGLMLLALPGAAQAEESWATDPKTGAKIGFIHPSAVLTAASWSGPAADGKAEGQGTLTVTVRARNGQTVNGQLEAEMLAGKLNGKVAAKWSNGDTFTGYYAGGLIDGKGIYKWASRGGRVYDGEYRNGLQDGYGVYKEANGKVLYEGQWKDGVPVSRPSLDKVLGIAWGASEDEVKKVMLARPKTTLPYNWKDGPITYHQYLGPFNDQSHWIFFRFYEGKAYAVLVLHSVLEAQLAEVMERFETTRKGLIERYGFADEDKGKYMDNKLYWYWPDRYFISLSVERMKNAPAPAFGMHLLYADEKMYFKAEGKQAAATGSKSDY
jgi:hypothetical protein